MKRIDLNFWLAIICLTAVNSVSALCQKAAIVCEGPAFTCSYALPNQVAHKYSVSMTEFDKCGKGKDCKYNWEVTNGVIVGGTVISPSKYGGDG